jgi:hypothetical protein
MGMGMRRHFPVGSIPIAIQAARIIDLRDKLTPPRIRKRE